MRIDILFLAVIMLFCLVFFPVSLIIGGGTTVPRTNYNVIIWQSNEKLKEFTCAIYRHEGGLIRFFSDDGKTIYLSEPDQSIEIWDKKD
jgi:hypothetical protein